MIAMILVWSVVGAWVLWLVARVHGVGPALVGLAVVVVLLFALAMKRSQ